MKWAFLISVFAIGAAIYSPKFREQKKSLARSSSVSAPDMASFIAVLPPNTNRYYAIFLLNPNPCGSGPYVLNWGTNSGIYTFGQMFPHNAGTHPPVPHLTNVVTALSNCDWTIVSNLIPGVRYYFGAVSNCVNAAEFTYPFTQLPYSNIINASCVGPLWISLKLFPPVWTVTTQRSFQLDQDLKTALYWRGTNLSFTRTNNQVPSIMHRQ